MPIDFMLLLLLGNASPTALTPLPCYIMHLLECTHSSSRSNYVDVRIESSFRFSPHPHPHLSILHCCIWLYTLLPTHRVIRTTSTLQPHHLLLVLILPSPAGIKPSIYYLVRHLVCWLIEIFHLLLLVLFLFHCLLLLLLPHPPIHITLL